MEAIQHIIHATKTDSLDVLKSELGLARDALRELEEAKLDEIADAVNRERSKAFGNAGMSPMTNEAREIPRERRPIRDSPQA